MPEKEKTSFLGTLSNSIKLIGSIAAFLSVIYNLSFFMVLDIDFFSVLSAEDHLMSFIVMMPIVASSLIVGFYFDPPWISEKDFPERYKKNPRWIALSTWKKNLYLLAPSLIVYCTLWFATDIDAKIIITLIAGTLWVCIVHSYLERSGITEIYSPPYKWYYTIGIVAILVASYGAEKAAEKLEQNPENLVTIQLENTSQPGYLIRASSKGVILKIPDASQLQFIPQDKIKSLTAPYVNYDFQEYRSVHVIRQYAERAADWIKAQRQSPSLSYAEKKERLTQAHFWALILLLFDGLLLILLGIFILLIPALWSREKINILARFYIIYLPRNRLYVSIHSNKFGLPPLGYFSKIAMGSISKLTVVVFFTIILPLALLILPLAGMTGALNKTIAIVGFALLGGWANTNLYWTYDLVLKISNAVKRATLMQDWYKQFMQVGIKTLVFGIFFLCGLYFLLPVLMKN